MRRKANGPNKTAIYQLKFDQREINRCSEFAKVTFTVRPSSEQGFRVGGCGSRDTVCACKMFQLSWSSAADCKAWFVFQIWRCFTTCAFEDDWILAKIFAWLFMDISASTSEQVWSAWSKLRFIMCDTGYGCLMGDGFRSSCQLFPPKVFAHAHCKTVQLQVFNGFLPAAENFENFEQQNWLFPSLNLRWPPSRDPLDSTRWILWANSKCCFQEIFRVAHIEIALWTLLNACRLS